MNQEATQPCPMTAAKTQSPLAELGSDDRRARPSQTILLVGLAAVVAIAVVLTHWPVLSAQALSFDDVEYFVENPLVKKPSGKTAARFLTEVLEPSSVGGYYQPVTMISLMLDYAMGGRAEYLRPFHRTSLAFHAANTTLVIVFLYLLFGQAWPAALAGLIFGLHPLTVEPVAWVADRKTVLASFFAIWCLILYVLYVRHQRLGLYAACVAAFILALMSKPTTTMLPLMLLLLDYWPLRRLTMDTQQTQQVRERQPLTRGERLCNPERQSLTAHQKNSRVIRQRLNRISILDKLPFLLVAGISAIITMVSQGRTAFVGLPTERSTVPIILGLCHNIVFYPLKMIWPSNLTSYYPQPSPMNLSQPQVLLGFLGTIVLMASLLVSLRWTRAFLAGWLMFFVVILPTMGGIGFAQVIVADKYAYLPAVGLLIILAKILCHFWMAASPHPAQIQRRAIVLGSVLVLAGLAAIGTRRYLTCWRDTETLHRHMVALAPQAVEPRCSLGHFLFTNKRANEAIHEYREALRIAPDCLKALNNLGYALIKQGKPQEAVEPLSKAVIIMPHFAVAHSNLGEAFLNLGRLEESITQLNKSLDLKQEKDLERRHVSGSVFNNLGIAHARQGKMDRAMDYFRQALEVMPDDGDALSNMANVLTMQGQLDKAIEYFYRSLKNNPDVSETHNNLGNVLLQHGEISKAVTHYTEALRLDPGNIGTHHNLGVAFEQQGRVNDAIREYREALRLNPANTQDQQRLNALLPKPEPQTRP